jgi:hypothetical protein
MAQRTEATWSQPIVLRLARLEAIYELEDLESISSEPGVYVFCRAYGDAVAPLYIGKALNLRRRIEQQLNSVRLMTRIRDAQAGPRFLIYCVPQLRPGQRMLRVISILEDALIAHALAEDFELLQKQGTKTPNHTIQFAGNRVSERLAPRRMRVAI